MFVSTVNMHICPLQVLVASLVCVASYEVIGCYKIYEDIVKGVLDPSDENLTK